MGLSRHVPSLQLAGLASLVSMAAKVNKRGSFELSNVRSAREREHEPLECHPPQVVKRRRRKKKSTQLLQNTVSWRSVFLFVPPRFVCTPEVVNQAHFLITKLEGVYVNYSKHDTQ